MYRGRKISENGEEVCQVVALRGIFVHRLSCTRHGLSGQRSRLCVTRDGQKRRL